MVGEKMNLDLSEVIDDIVVYKRKLPNRYHKRKARREKQKIGLEIIKLEFWYYKHLFREDTYLPLLNSLIISEFDSIVDRSKEELEYCIVNPNYFKDIIGDTPTIALRKSLYFRYA